MNRAIAILLCASICLVMGGAAALSQTFDFSKLPESVRWTVEEKLKWRLEMDSLKRAHGVDDVREVSGIPNVAGLREALVSGDPAPESELHAAINPTDSNNIVVSPIRFTFDNGLLCPIYYTKDFGKTWHESTFENKPRFGALVATTGGDPVLSFDADGRLYLVWLSVFPGAESDSAYWGMFWASSTDGGATWTREDNDIITMTKAAGTFPTSIYSLPTIVDKEWIAVDRTNKATRNTVYVTCTRLSFMSTGVGEILLFRKRPDRKYFEPYPLAVTDGAFQVLQFSNVAVDSEGDVHVTFYASHTPQSSVSLWHVEVKEGTTPGTPHKISDFHMGRFIPGSRRDNIAGINPDRLYPCPSFAIDNSNGPHAGSMYLTWTADGIRSRGTDGMEVYFSRLTNGGVTWSTPKAINDDAKGKGTHQHYSSIFVNSNGVIALTWYDRRDDLDNTIANYYMAYSFDGGQTFTRNFPVSTMPTNFNTVGTRNANFGVGEYTQVVMTDGYAIPFWSDGRNGDGDLQVYSAFIPLSADPLAHSNTHRVVPVTDGHQLLAPIHSATGDRVTLTFELFRPSRVVMKLVDVNGNLVSELLSGMYGEGKHTHSIAAADLPSGRYFCVLESASGTTSVPVTIVR